MRLSIAYNGAKNGIELLFSEELENQLAVFLREFGFKESLSNPKMWYTTNHPAYKYYAKSLKEAFDNGRDWLTIEIQPSFSPSLENIDNNKFSIVTIYYQREGEAEGAIQDYVLFDSYKRVATKIAWGFGLETYGDDLKHLEVFSRNYKRKARSLFKEGKIISATTPLGNNNVETNLPLKEEEETEISKLRETLNEVIEKLLTLEKNSEGESKTIIGTMLFNLEAGAKEQDDIRFKNQLLKSIQFFKDWVGGLNMSLGILSTAFMSKLTQLLDGTSISKVKQKVKENKTPETTELEEPIVKEEETEISKLREALNEVIGELLTLEETLEGESETIIGTTLFDLEEAAEEQNDIHFKNKILESIQLFKDWVDDLDASSRLIAIASMSKLTQLLDGTSISEEQQKIKGKSITKDIFSRDHIVQNVLVPSQAGEPFQSGGLYVNERNFLKFKFPQLYKINDNNLNEVSGLALFQLSQMAHPKDYGIDVNRSTVLQVWESRGREAFEEIGFPTDLNYPYVNIHTGYKSISPLGAEVQAHEDKHKWWAVVEHARPIADLAKGIAIIDDMLMELVEKRLEVINPKTGKSKTDKKSKEIYSDISWQIERLEKSKQVILDYLNKDEVPEESKEQTKPKKKKTKKQKDYIDRVIAVMHIAYTESKRLSKKKIEILKEETGTPNLGMLWEAVELSWLLWYKMIYREPILFEDRLRKMEQFWNNVQPTYAYSDSSKELYKQYSTPCPIGAIIAEYTQMKTADYIFEPSAGNGLLVMGANPRITHVNEIDTNRKHSLEYQKFGKITNENAAEPFPEIMYKVHDVVVTNPPFAKWEASKFDKERISQKYFQNNLGVANNIRLEHLMSGFALYTMTDHGRAAIIIMGHIYFGEDGLLAKYRPFFNWLYRHYIVDDVINMNSYKLYNRQGAVERTMLILIGGRKKQPGGVAPTQEQAPYLDTMAETFPELWKRVKSHIKPTINTLIEQLKIVKT